MRKIIKFLKPNLKLVRGTRLTSGLFIGASIAVAAGVLFAANIYYDIDTSKIMVEDTQQATTTQITVDSGNTTALTVTQRGSAAAVSVTSTASMTSDIFKISNLGSGKSFVVEDEDTDTTSAFVVDAGGNVGVASSTPSATLSVQGNIIGSGNLILYGSVTSTLGKVEITGFKYATSSMSISSGYVLTTDTQGYGTWQAVPSGVWSYLGTTIYPTGGATMNIVIGSSTDATPRYDLDVWGNASFGTTTDYTKPLLLVNSYTTRVGIASSTPSDTFAVQGNIISSGNIKVYDTSTSTFGGAIDIQGFKMTTGSPGAKRVLTTVDGSGYGVWTSIAGAGGISGSGTVGAIPKFDPDSQTIGNSVIAESGGNIGISNAGPTSKLTVSGGNIVVSTDGSATTTISSEVSTFAGGFISQASSTIAATTTIVGGLIVDGNTLYVMADTNRVGIASSTPSDTFSVMGNIIGNGNIILYGSATSTLGGDLYVAGLETTGSIWSDNAITVTSLGGAITLTPASGSNANIILGGAGLFTVGSAGQFKIDASGNVTTTGNIYADAFISTGDNAYTRKPGDEILRGVVPIFGFDLPVRCKTSCDAGSATATISRIVENDDDIFPMVFTGTTRRYRFTIRYADATTTATTRTTWDIATSSDRTYVDRFTLPSPGTGDLAAGFTTTTNFVTLPTTDDWFLRVSTGGSGNYDLQVYDIMLIGIDQVN